MKFLMITKTCSGLGAAFRLKEEGHDVTVNMPANRCDYDGLLKKVAKFGDNLSKDTVIVFDSTGGGKTAERLRQTGYPVIGTSAFSDQLELDRELAMGIMEEAGILTGKRDHFTDWEAAKRFAAEVDRAVIKPNSKALFTYVSSSTENAIAMMEHFEQTGEPCDVECQEHIDGLEISTEGWFDGEKFSPPFNHTLERKNLMNDDLGPAGGCAGNIVWACSKPNCRIVNEGIARLAPVLKNQGEAGPYDLNTIVNGKGVFGLELSPRFGYDALPALLEMLTADFGDLLSRYATRTAVDRFPIRDNEFGSAVRVTTPPYPGHEPASPKDVPILNLTRNDRRHSYFYGVYLDKDLELKTSGGDGMIAAFTGLGPTIRKSMEGPMLIAKRVEVPNKEYRTDLTDYFERAYEQYLMY